ncbi:MAG: hypothetical protein GY703_18345 [Gammaproteobacteria bacterium]|nr:hypothetical protein [Gammaproteobacteria bacterium]
MSQFKANIQQSIENLNINKSGTRRAPHKPLLLLLAISKLQQGESSLSFQEIENELLPLLKAYAPPVVGSHQPELPYWHLQTSGLWEVSDADSLPLQAAGFPRMAGLRQTHAGFTDDVAAYLKGNPEFTAEIVDYLLEEHFPLSVQDDLVSRLNLARSVQASDLSRHKKSRDPTFRNKVLRAYEHRCAVTGFQAMLGGIAFGCEAAHVQWHAYDGPDTVSNGLCLEPTLHKLFDAGAWSLDDNRRILVSKEFSGSETAISRLRIYHCQKLASPMTGEPEINLEFIRWHREPEFGGVFRKPALDV